MQGVVQETAAENIGIAGSCSRKHEQICVHHVTAKVGGEEQTEAAKPCWALKVRGNTWILTLVQCKAFKVLSNGEM